MAEIVPSISLNFVAGDDLVLRFTVTLDGVAVNITDMTPHLAIARTRTDTAVVSTEVSPPTAVVTLTTPLSGIFEVAIAGEDTEALRGTYVFEAEVEDVANAKSTVARGYMTFEAPLIS